MSQQKWTPEPWIIAEPEVCIGGNDMIVFCTLRYKRDHPEMTPHTTEQRAANLARIVSCVNALALIRAPAAYVARAAAIEAAARMLSGDNLGHLFDALNLPGAPQ